MIVCYFRSSSYNNWDFCQQQYFITYLLGKPSPDNKKAEMGTIVHKVMECLAHAKKSIQDGRDYFEDDQLGKHSIKEGNVYTDGFVDFLFEESYKYYTEKSDNEYTNADKNKIHGWCWRAINHLDGAVDPRNRNIYAPELHFDFEIPEDWANYSFEDPIDGHLIEGTLSLKGTVDLICDEGNGLYESVDWKGLPLDTKLPIPNGWTTMGEIQVGDTVFDQYGKQTKVIGKSEIKNKDCYKIIFDDKTTVECDDEHLWKLIDGRTVSILDLKIKDKIKVASPLDIEDVDLPIDPYVLGIWLGDGRNRTGEITSSDNFIFKEISKRGYKVGKNIASKDGCQTKTIIGLRTELRKLNLLHNKHIPIIYLRSSLRQRLDLLRGLMDSDGNANPYRKQAVFTSCNKRLSDDVKQLALTLGQRPNQCKTKQRGFGLEVDAYPIHFRPININPFLLPRKAKKIKKWWGHGDSYRRLIKKIEKIPSKETQCIMVDSPDNTYLCTENMIPTHNTGQRLDWTSNKPWPHNIKTHDKLCVDPQLRIYHYALNQVIPNMEQLIPTIYFINDHGTKTKPVPGGLFSMCYTKNDIELTKKMIRKRFEQIKENIRPQLLFNGNHWKCRSLCHFGKSEHPSGLINPNTGNPHTICSYINHRIKEVGIDQVIKEEKHPGHHYDKYHAPGT